MTSNTRSEVVVVDCGHGNLASVSNALKAIGEGRKSRAPVFGAHDLRSLTLQADEEQLPAGMAGYVVG